MLISNGYVNVNITKADENRLRISITGNLLVEARRIWFVLVEEKGGREEKIFPFIIIRIIISDIYIYTLERDGVTRLLYFTDKYREVIRDYRVYTNNVEFFFFLFLFKNISYSISMKPRVIRFRTMAATFIAEHPPSRTTDWLTFDESLENPVWWCRNPKVFARYPT